MKKFEVALVKRACPICGKEVDSEIIMNQKLTKKAAEEVKNLHGKVIGYADKVCEDCSKYKDNLFIIEIDPEKSDMKRMETIYRTGRYLVCDKNCQLYTAGKFSGQYFKYASFSDNLPVAKASATSFHSTPE